MEADEYQKNALRKLMSTSWLMITIAEDLAPEVQRDIDIQTAKALLHKVVLALGPININTRMQGAFDIRNKERGW